MSIASDNATDYSAVYQNEPLCKDDHAAELSGLDFQTCNVATKLRIFINSDQGDWRNDCFVTTCSQDDMIKIGKYRGAVYTELDSDYFGGTINNPDGVRIEYDGTNITGYIENSGWEQRVQAAHSVYAGGRIVGFQMVGRESVTPKTITCDNWRSDQDV